jgi:hypothetical protein
LGYRSAPLLTLRRYPAFVREALGSAETLSLHGDFQRTGD